MAQPPRRYRMIWRDGAFVPDGARLAEFCDHEFGEGEVVTFERHEERSTRSEGHYFACIKDVWDSLPENEQRFPTPDSLRKWALIRSGYCTVTDMVLESEKDAQTVAAFMGNSDGVIIVVRGNVVRRYTAKSQARSAMKNDEFQRSKQDVLDTIAELLAVKRKELEKSAGASA